jgi:hypothetical protein
VNALADQRVSDYLNDTFVCTYLKVGTFQIINGQKVGGNVASYFCLADGAVLHAVAGKVQGDKLLQETRWASDTRKTAQLKSTRLATGKMDMTEYARQVRLAHGERYHLEINNHFGDKTKIPQTMPILASQQAKAHWLLAKQPLAELDTVYPIVWRQILGEQLSALPVQRN